MDLALAALQDLALAVATSEAAAAALAGRTQAVRGSIERVQAEAATAATGKEALDTEEVKATSFLVHSIALISTGFSLSEAYGGGSGPRGYGDGNRSNSGPGSYGNRGGNDRYGGGPSDRYGGGGPDRYGGGPGRPPGYEGPFDRRPGGGVGRDSYGSGYGGRRSPSPSSRGYGE